MLVKSSGLTNRTGNALVFLLFQILSPQIVLSNYNFNISSCDAHPWHSSSSNFLICTVQSEKPFKSECVGSSAAKIWFRGTDPGSYVLCFSDKFIEVDAVFEDGRPSMENSYVHYETYDIEPYFVYSVKMYALDEDLSVVRYLIQNWGNKTLQNETEQTTNEVSVMIFYSNRAAGAAWMDTYNKSQPKIVFAKEEVLIPCVPTGKYNPDMLYIVHGPHTNETLESLIVDNTSIRYEPSSGFIFNASLISNYNRYLYRCWPVESDNIWWDFHIKDTPDLQINPSKESVRLFVSQKINRVPVRLECNYIHPIRLEGTLSTNSVEDHRLLENFYTHGEGPDKVWPETTASDIQNRTKYTTQIHPTLRYTGVYENELNVFAHLRVKCVNVSDEYILHVWNVTVHDTARNSDGLEYLRFIDQRRSRRTNDLEFQCYSGVSTDVRLRTIKCNNVFQCLLLEQCFDDDRNCQLDLEEAPCSGNYYYSYRTCKNVPAAVPGGITLCTAGGFNYTKIHFVGFDDKIYNFGETVPDEAIIKIQYNSKIFYSKEVHTFTCTVHQFYSDAIIMFVIAQDEDRGERKILYDEGVYSQNMTTNPTHPQGGIKIINVNMSSPGSIIISCLAVASFPDKEFRAVTDVLEIIESIAPEIVTAVTDREFLEGDEDVTIECQATGRPAPSIKWTWEAKELNDLDGSVSVQGIEGINNTMILKFKKFSKDKAGQYKCCASNVAGDISKVFNILVKKDTNKLIGIMVGAIGVVLSISSLLAFYLRYRIVKKPEIKMSEAEEKEYIEGKVQETPGDNPIFIGPETDYMKLPFLKKFQIKQEDIEFIDEKDRLGGGQFGYVYKGRLVQLTKQFAFKTTKTNCPKHIFDALLKEIKIMSYMEGHENVVQFVGAYIDEIKYGKVFIVTVYCENGSMKDFFEKARCYYQDRPSVSNNSANPSHYEPVGCTLAFGFNELIRWSGEAASGMAYLASQKIVHLDLAARNVLLTGGEQRVLKISDFGLSRRQYTDIDYIRLVAGKGQELMIPWRWLAIECLESNKFSTQSDVWAYGILLWEIFELGQRDPYPECTLFPGYIEFAKQLRGNTVKLEKPEKATEKIFQAMERCWAETPTSRPTFKEMETFFLDLLKSPN